MWDTQAHSPLCVTEKVVNNLAEKASGIRGKGGIGEIGVRIGRRGGGAEVAAAGDGSVCAAITYCSIATISQPPTIRISHQCCIMEQITRLRIYRHSSTGKIAQIWNILNILSQDSETASECRLYGRYGIY